MAGRWRDPTVRRWLAFALGCLAATLINPYGINLLLQIGRFLLNGSLASGGEWSSWDFSQVNLFGPWIVLAWGVALVQGIRLPFWRTLAFLLIVYVTLRHLRNINLIAFVVPVLLAKPLGQHWAARRLNSVERLMARTRPQHGPVALAAAASSSWVSAACTPATRRSPPATTKPPKGP